MTLAIWRLAHLTLAVFSFLFLVIASITGTVLAVDAIYEKTSPYKVRDFESLTLSDVLPVLQDKYPELLEIRVDHNQFVVLEAFDDEGNDVKAYIDPSTGNNLGVPKAKSDFIQWTTSLHRSLFMHETGRFIVGFISFLLLFIAITGTILIMKRQRGIRRFFSRINKDFWEQHLHVVIGRWLLIPIIIISATGSYLFLVRFEVFSKAKVEEFTAEEFISDGGNVGDPKSFKIFKNVYLKDIDKIEFPFDDDPSEYYKLRYQDKEQIVNQFSGEVIHETIFPTIMVWEAISLNLHTGRTNVIWAAILGMASLNILFFIYSGFVITFKRKSVRIKNKYNANQATHILLVGSENGSTYRFAYKVLKQLWADGKKAYVTDMNKYQRFDKMTHLLVFTSTYGLGDAPDNGKRFLSLVNKITPSNKTFFSVVGFGSTAYKDYCAFAAEVDHHLYKQPDFIRQLPLYRINDKSPNDLVDWVRDWSVRNKVALATTSAVYTEKLPKMKSLKVMQVTKATNEDQVFEVLLKSRQKFRSGDLLVIYPKKDHRERFYSIGRYKGFIRLVVKLHDKGLGSQFLYGLNMGTFLKGRVVNNPSFHLPKKTQNIVMIANGTGIAPFLGMVEENVKRRNIRLYAGFRYPNATTFSYDEWADHQIAKGKLAHFQMAFSRAEASQYVIHLLEKDSDYLSEVLQSNGTILICGSLAMQNDVEKVLDRICYEHQLPSLHYFKEKGQLLTDCY